MAEVGEDVGPKVGGAMPLMVPGHLPAALSAPGEVFRALIEKPTSEPLNSQGALFLLGKVCRQPGLGSGPVGLSCGLSSGIGACFGVLRLKVVAVNGTTALGLPGFSAIDFVGSVGILHIN